MYKKPFVSIVFSSKKLQIVKLDSSLKRVEKFGSFNISEGVIGRYRVLNNDSLVKTIKDAWKKLGLREKSVGLVIPEFLTFTKSFSVPVLEHEELDEAIRWNMQEFLPFGLQDIVMDWQILQRQENNYEVLVVAMLREVLSSYVTAASDAGLLPLVVETPSLSLTRVAVDKGDGKLIVYVNPDETNLVVSKGDQIFASSVVKSSSQAEILKTALRILNHYQSSVGGAKNIFVGGSGLSQVFLKSLETTLGLPVNSLDFKIEGLAPAEVQEYLLGISLQLKDPAEPESETTINLLPPTWVKVYQDKHLLWQIWTLLLVTSIALWSCLLAVLSVFIILTVRAENLKIAEAQSLTPENTKTVLSEIESINKLSEKTILITDHYHLPQEVVNKITGSRPEGVTISKYEINLESGKVSLLGRALKRADLIEFKRRLESVTEFTEVSAPVSDLVSEIDIDFSLSFIYGPAKPEAKASAPKLKI